MTWMLTATGAKVDLAWIAHDSISVLDIAHHLAQINRYTGACARPYSVAEHSLLVVELLERHTLEPAAVRLAALMHDAHEAYTADLSSPMKQVLGPAWELQEARIQHTVLQHFGLHDVYTVAHDSIKWADLTALSTERRALLPASGPGWQCTASHPPVDWVDFEQRARFTWLDWRQAFLDKFAELRYDLDLNTEKVPA